MTNNIRVKKVPITLDKERTLAYDLNAYCELEQFYNQVDNPEQLISNIYNEVNGVLTGLSNKTKIDDVKATLENIIDKQANGFAKFYRSFLNGSPTAIRALLWAGLIHEDESLTVKETGKLIGSDLNGISLKILDAMSPSLPEADEEKNE